MKDPTDKCNYRSVNTLPLLSKMFEKIMYDQLYISMHNFMNELLCRFRKVHSTQHAFFEMLQAWQKELDNSGFIRTILMDLQKTYDCLLHDLVIVKSEAYGFGRYSLRLLMGYLNSLNNEQRLVHPIASGLKLTTEFHKVLYWDPFYSIYL